MIRKQPKCLNCDFPITWDEQRRSYARAIQRYGLSPEEAKRIMPRCGKCLTELLNPGRRRGVAAPYHRPLR
jgi:hypothetical protein